MSKRTRARVAWGVFGLALGLTLLGVWLNILNAHKTTGLFSPNLLLLPTFGIVGAVVTSRTGHRIGWLFLGVGFLGALTSFSFAYAVRSATGPTTLPVAPQLAAISNIGFPLTFLALGTLLLLFPTGALPSPRWKWVTWAFGLSWGVLAVTALIAAQIELGDTLKVANPFAVGVLAHLPLLPYRRAAATQIWTIAGVLTLIAAATAPFFRWRSAEAEARQQLKWLSTVTIATILTTLLAAVSPPRVADWLFFVPMAFAVVGVPVAVGVAVMRYRLYDLDVVIKKALVFGTLATFIALVYAAIVGGLGAIIGSRSNPVLSFTAAAVLAIAFQPARARARRFADRLVYGKRATPYEVLAEFSDRMAETYATEDVLPQMAQILAAGTGAEVARVWLNVAGELRPVAASGIADETQALRISGDRVPEVPGEHAVEVRHQRELLGALSVRMPAADPMNPSKDSLVRDLAAQAGLVLRNVRLISELKASRQRLVAAQDEERRKLERNLHDGAQQQLVALAVKLRLAEQLASRDPARVEEMLSNLQTDTQDALENLRDLARGIYPPLLADKGLAAALEGQARKASIPVEVSSDGTGRYPQETEAAVYFSCLEALQNVAKYAHATRAEIRLSQANGHLTFEVTDDGQGFDANATTYGTGLQGIADRLDSIGGTLDVRSAQGQGTTIAGRVPVTVGVRAT